MKTNNFNKGMKSLNPCFNGRYTLTIEEKKEKGGFWSLNPCFNGRYTLTVNVRYYPEKTYELS